MRGIILLGQSVGRELNQKLDHFARTGKNLMADRCGQDATFKKSLSFLVKRKADGPASSGDQRHGPGDDFGCFLESDESGVDREVKL